MKPLQIKVTAEAVRALRYAGEVLCMQSEKMEQNLAQLHRIFEENAAGLGAHTNKIRALLEELDDQALEAKKANHKIVLRMERAAKIREILLEENPYKNTEKSTVDEYIPQVLGHMYDELVRNRIHPHELGADKDVVGTWKDQVFYASDSYVPTKFNPEGKTFGQIRQELYATYKINFGGISYKGGYADFGSVALVQLSVEDVIPLSVSEAGCMDYEEILKRRTENFKFADELTAARHIEIPGLGTEYTAAELKAWREAKHFTWDESFAHGYLLVPSVVHGNLSHTGLVGVMTHGKAAEEAFAKRHGGDKA